MRYAYKRHYEWSANLAYCVGLMASDGCLKQNGRHLDLTSVDIQQLENFCVGIGREVKISRKKSGDNRYAHRVQFSDVALYDFLLNVGLTPVKSKTIGALCIPDEYYVDFLRGVFDGDGTIYGYFDKRWRSSLMFYLQFSSASEQFLEYIRTTNVRLIGLSQGSVKYSTRAFVLSYAKNDSYKLYRSMYYASDVLALERKRSKIQSFIAADKAVIMCRNARVVESVDTYA